MNKHTPSNIQRHTVYEMMCTEKRSIVLLVLIVAALLSQWPTDTNHTLEQCKKSHMGVDWAYGANRRSDLRSVESCSLRFSAADQYWALCQKRINKTTSINRCLAGNAYSTIRSTHYGASTLWVQRCATVPMEQAQSRGKPWTEDNFSVIHWACVLYSPKTQIT